MGRTPFLLLLLLLAVLLWVAAPSVRAAPDYELRLVQLLHRHGARSPIVSYNETAICGTVYPCGHLNAPGQTMLRNVGAFLRERYTQDAAVVDPSAPFLTSDVYNLTVSYSRSTDVLRTLQSSVALLRGLFPDMAAYYPAVHTVDSTTDTLLLTDTVPSVRVKRHYGRPELEAECLPLLDKRFPDFAVLLAVAREVHSEGRCADRQKRLDCAFSLCDIGLAYEATGELGKYKKLKGNLEKICVATECASRFQLAYNGSDPVQVRQGSVGQALAQEMIRNMKAATTPAGTTFKLYEYSAHDTTVSPFAATLGDDSALAMMPPFGTTFVVELLSKRKERSGGARKAKRESEERAADYFVRVVRGSPGVTPESGYAFELTAFDMRCQSAYGRVYVAEDNVCPLEDFVRFVDTSQPQSEAGLCHLDPVYAQRMGCPVSGPLPVSERRTARGGVDDEGDLSDDCLFYRRACPAFACQPGYHVSAVDYGCYATKPAAAKQERGDDTSAVVAVGAVAFLLGGLVGLGLLLAKRLCEQGRRRQGYDLPSAV